MIYSDKFVWLHFPKMAGSAVERIFRSRFRWDRSIVRDRVSPLMVRLRLVEPFWLYSRHMFEVRGTPLTLR